MNQTTRDALERKIAELLDSFYKRRIEALQKVHLDRTIRRKNPYLYRAIGTNDASEIVTEILRAFVSSSDETIFGNEFFEPLAKAAVEILGTGKAITSGSEGVDVQIESETVFSAYAVKSGTSVFNSQSKARQKDDFEALRKRLFKLKKQFDPVVGYCYGRKKQAKSTKLNFRELAGQSFWEEITKDPDFYITIIELMRDKPQEHAVAFVVAFDEAKNRLVAQFSDGFVDKSTGKIDWSKLIEYVSGAGVKAQKELPMEGESDAEPDATTE